MNPEEEDSDKQFEPSQKKLDDARLRGEVAKSNDIITAASYGGILFLLASFGPGAVEKMAGALSIILAQSDQLAEDFFTGSKSAIMGSILEQAFWGLVPWFFFPMILALLAVLSQRALVFAPSKLKPKLNRISVISGLKNKFGRQGLFEFAKSMVKLLIYSFILISFLVAKMDEIVGFISLPPRLIVLELGQILLLLTVLVFAVSTILGLVDFIWQKAEHIRKNRMSRKEMMEELKQSEGDPHFKQQRRQRAQDIAMNKMLADVVDADVVIVNPTHFSVALNWDRLSGRAPVCVAKGVDEIAAKIREIAWENSVPVHSDPPTARALYAGVKIGEEIQPEHYRAVAAAIRFAEDIRGKART